MEPIRGNEEYMIDPEGNVWSNKTNRFLKPQMNRGGYLQVGLWKDNKRTIYRIYKLVAIHFIENPNNFTEVDHIDRNKLNNQCDNLRWVSRSQNNRNKDCKGYCWSKRAQKYQAQYSLNHKLYYIGLFETEEEAKEAYLNAIKDL
jgi:hypothetical protein